MFGKMTGTEGKLEVPSIGAVIGTMNKWSLRREESSSGNPGLLTLRANFSYLNESLAHEEVLSKQVTITVRRGTHFRVLSQRTAFEDGVLVMEDCKLERIED